MTNLTSMFAVSKRNNFSFLRFLGILVVFVGLSVGDGWGANLINENIQSWTNHGSYGNYTQAITAGTVTMTACIVANAASTTGTCTAGRVQMNSSTGIIELPALATCGTAEFHLAAGAARTIKLQKYNGSTWDDLTTFSITTTGATFTYNVNSGNSTTLRLASPSGAVYVHDIIVTDYSASTPTITLTPTTLTGFTYVQGAGPSAEQTFTVAGSNLTADISLAASTNYEISKTSGSGYATPLTFTQSSGTVGATTVYVRLKAGLSAGNYNGETLSATSTGASDKTITCSGSVTSPPPPTAPTATAATSVGSTGFTANWGAVSGATGYKLDVYQGGIILTENFAAITTGDNTTSTGSSTAWTGNTNFTVSTAYQAGGTVRIGSSSATGSITTKALDLTNGATLTFDVKGWTTVEGDINVIVDAGTPQTVTYTAVMGSSFETKTVTLAAATAASTVTIATSTKRAFIDNVVIESKNFSLNDFSVGNVQTYAVSSLSPSTTYKYVVRATNANGTSGNSNTINVTTLIPTFTGTGDWSDVAHWNTGVVPGNTESVIIDGAVTLSSNVEVAGLTINASKSLTVNAAKQLTVTGALANNGTLNLLSTVAGTATLTAGSVSGSGTAHVSQYLANARNWYVSSPVSNAIPPSSGYTFYERNEAAVSWPSISTPNFVPGRGYIALPGATGATLTFSTETGGNLNTGNVTVPLTFSGATSKGFNLIGNPYPSHLTWTQAFVDDVTNAALIEPTIWLRTNAKTENSGVNADWSFITCNALVGESVPVWANVVIAPMQGFWVKAKKAGNLIMDNKLTRSHQASNPLKAPAQKNTDRQRLRLQVSDGISTDEALIYFDASASNAYDAYDSQKMLNGTNSTVPDIYTMVGTEQLVINGMKTIPTEIPLYFKANASTVGQFSISSSVNNFEEGTLIYIKNSKTGDQQLISDGTVFNFDAASQPNLSIIIKVPGTITDVENNNSAILNVFANAKRQITVTTPSVKENDVVSVYNSAGQCLMSQSLTSTRTILNRTFTSGVYIVKVNEISRKLIVN